MRDDVAPQIGRGRIAVQKDDRVALAEVDVGHLDARCLETLAGMWINGRDGCVAHRIRSSRARLSQVDVFARDVIENYDPGARRASPRASCSRGSGESRNLVCLR